MSSWVVLRVDVPPAIADRVATLLEEEGAPGVVREESETVPGRTRVEAHLPGDDATRVRDLLAQTLGSDAAIASAPIGEVDWDAIARRHHPPRLIGARLLVAPPWNVPPADGRELLVIEPGMAFGTGQHATTRGCLEAIEALLATSPVRSALDVGTGSGILALALARLGVARVVGCDTDATAVSIARANLDRNGATGVTLVVGPAAALRDTFEVVVANLLADVIIADAAALTACVTPAGQLVLSGLLRGQVTAVLAAYGGWRVVDERAEDDWRTLVLARAS